jgi:hypothetical protein
MDNLGRSEWPYNLAWVAEGSLGHLVSQCSWAWVELAELVGLGRMLKCHI